MVRLKTQKPNKFSLGVTVYCLILFFIYFTWSEEDQNLDFITHQNASRLSTLCKVSKTTIDIIIHNPLIWFKIFRPFLLKNTKQTKKKTTTTYYGSSTPKPVEVHSDKLPNTGLSKYFMSIIIKMMMTSLIRNNNFWLIISISTGRYMSIEIDHRKASWKVSSATYLSIIVDWLVKFVDKSR